MTETENSMTTEVVSVKFRQGSTAYYFDPRGIQYAKGSSIIVETSKGLEMCTVTAGNHPVPEESVVQPLRPVIRAATEADLALAESCRGKEKDAFVICRQKIEAHGLDMKLINVEYNFDGSKIVFYFSSDGRVDFRDLVKDLAGVFRTRIELRQIGVRDEARMLGGLGICGRPFCCCFSMQEFQPVSTKMAKTQSMSLNPAKISGACGRLMCCLRYEQPAYEELVKNVPKNGAFVETPDGYGNVTQVNVLRQTVKVRMDSKDGDVEIRQYEADEVAAIPGGRPRDGAEPPHVLELKPKKKPEDEEPQDDWQVPDMLIASPEELRRRTEQAERLERRQETRQALEAMSNPGRRRGDRKPHVPSQAGSKQPPRQRPQKPSRPAADPQRTEAGAPAAVPGIERPKQKQQRRHRPNGGKPAHNNNAPQEEKAVRQPAEKKDRPTPENKPRKEAAGGQPAEKQQNKPRKHNNHRRYYRPKSDNNGGGTPKQE